MLGQLYYKQKAFSLSPSLPLFYHTRPNCCFRLSFHPTEERAAEQAYVYVISYLQTAVVEYHDTALLRVHPIKDL